MGRAFYGGATPSTQCPSTAGARTSPGRNLERACGSQDGRRSHGHLGWQPLGGATRRNLRRASWSAGGNRKATGRLSLVAFPEPLSAPAPLSGSGVACGKSFRPTASRTYRKTPIKSLQKCSSEPSVADTSIWQKTGHFYFALTGRLLSTP